MKAKSAYNPPFLLKFALLAALLLVEAIHLRSNGQRSAFQATDRYILDSGSTLQQTVNETSSRVEMQKPSIN